MYHMYCVSRVASERKKRDQIDLWRELPYAAIYTLFYVGSVKGLNDFLFFFFPEGEEVGKIYCGTYRGHVRCLL